MIHAASRSALADLRERLIAVLSTDSDVTGASSQALASQLYAASNLLATQPRLRRTLADPSTDASARGQLARSLLTGRLDETAVGLVVDAVAERWSSPWDLTDALEIIADETLLASAEQQGQLDTVEDELFRFERILTNAPELTTALDDESVPGEARSALAQQLLAGKVNPVTSELLAHAVTSGRKHHVLSVIDDLLEASAARRERSVARVIAATDLTPEQTERLAASLRQLYGRDITIRTAVDPGVRGGLVVRVGDEVIDGTVATRLAAARAAFAG